MEIDLDRLCIAITTHDFDENNKKDELTKSLQEMFGNILKKFYVVDGSIVILFERSNETK